MPLTEAQQISIAKILKVTIAEVGYQDDALGAALTAAMITAIQDEIDRWEGGAGQRFTDVMPFGENKGAKLLSESEKNDIRDNIALMMEREDWMAAGGAGQTVLLRG